jgi:branched-chain amino acid aminotransferase
MMPSDLECADEVFITSTTRDLLPVFQIEDKQIARGNRTRSALQEAFSKYLRDYVESRRVAKV